MPSDAELLEIQLRTGFVCDGSGRMARTNDPDRSAAPGFYLAGCASGNVAAVGADVPDDIAGELLALAVSEPPFMDTSGAPRAIVRYRELLSAGRRGSEPSLGVTCVLPNDLAYAHDVRLVLSDSEAGLRLRSELAANGVPAGLAGMGFVDVSEFWEPWCAVLHGGEVASLAFAARLSAVGADLGLATAPAFRGRGFAAAATAGWARMPALSSRALFYSTDQSNTASRRVIARLGLRLLGASLRLS